MAWHGSHNVEHHTMQVVLTIDASGAVQIVPGALPVLLELARRVDLYLITQCDNDLMEKIVCDTLAECGVFAAGMNPNVPSLPTSRPAKKGRRLTVAWRGTESALL